MFAMQRDACDPRYLLMRYEELVGEPLASAARLAQFLNIESLPILQEPTVAGRPRP